ncbi:SAM-dependent methyltransferase [Thioalkalivibrio sp. HK1]|uniref:SAM-dependent methyltransferase n=1 Tax=Thioalkalivibrio sp. HK1 TaxID=1469245 RepID=UPI000470EA1C|nr:cyclopropane-fatty-acyl-phospholipid synthase family protein [Thioalkalivibrio sp. HK1]
MKEGQGSHPLGLSGTRGEKDASERHTKRPSALDRWIVRRIAAQLGRPPVAIALWNGEDIYHPVGECHGRILFRDRQALQGVAFAPELGFGDAYSADRIDVIGDLIDVLMHCYRSAERAGSKVSKRGLLGGLPKPGSNTRTNSRKHIHHHYDLGNDFYRLWLDENMVYTCAYYDREDATLEQAQEAKMDHVCRKLMLKPDQTVVEAGCGWGTLALYMAREYGVKVRAFNISTEQIAHAREEATRQGLADKVEFVQDDYRNINGDFDAFVSVGMLEHVGVDNYQTLGDVISRSLKPEGLALIHSVGRNRPTPVNAWLEQRIFPGSYPPSLREMMDIFEPHNFSIIDIENLRLHYARTLREWLTRFDRVVETVRAKYDESFVRAWRLYLAGCSAAFASNSLQLFQVVCAPSGNNKVPWTRAHIYPASKASNGGGSSSPPLGD